VFRLKGGRDHPDAVVVLLVMEDFHVEPVFREAAAGHRHVEGHRQQQRQPARMSRNGLRHEAEAGRGDPVVHGVPS
jgi:hypothetical protein